ncbi:hypothetical protein BC936DRAFT_149761 [Jimgerdemannia flammicorona]|uniref:Uncharacterized protein n=1 Tax=Jimgerdemannia flammicorona TaxID=994334 RepID=A0A433DJS7_9FUNG|nr:hypothetical protein BC936DRAFT_149761 [Jimgerdemannia flammicorona]
MRAMITIRVLCEFIAGRFGSDEVVVFDNGTVIKVANLHSFIHLAMSAISHHTKQDSLYGASQQAIYDFIRFHPKTRVLRVQLYLDGPFTFLVQTALIPQPVVAQAVEPDHRLQEIDRLFIVDAIRCLGSRVFGVGHVVVVQHLNVVRAAEAVRQADARLALCLAPPKLPHVRVAVCEDIVRAQVRVELVQVGEVHLGPGPCGGCAFEVEIGDGVVKGTGETEMEGVQA